MTLVEAIVSIAIFAVVSVSLYTLITLGVQLVRDDQARLDAVALAQSTIEQLHNVPYDDIGTVGGIPTGTFEQSHTEIHNNTTYTVALDIRYVDDPFDGSAPTDTISTDYKQIRVSVTWEGQYIAKPVVLLTTISPEGLESNGGGGTLWIEAYTASASPISNATVRITNPSVIPAVDITSATDSNGRFLLPGTPASVQGYQIVISKSGYAPTQTYTVDSETNPNPEPGDQTVTEGGITTKVFYIDRHSDLTIHIQDATSGVATSGLPIRLMGAKRIGTALDGSDIPKYDEALTTDANGDISVNDIEYDTYRIVIDDSATGYDIAGTPTPLPFVLAPNTAGAITLHTASNADNTLLVTVQNESETALEGASVRIYTESLSVDVTQTTNASGQTFFSPLPAGIYTLEVTLNGYDFFQDQFDVTDDIQQIIPLTPTP
jgi:hypothetical protein